MSAVIYAAIVVMWAVVLVPMWLRRHDAATEARSVDRFSTAMRTLSRRTTSAPGRRYVVMPRRSEGGVSVHVSGAAAAEPPRREQVTARVSAPPPRPAQPQRPARPAAKPARRRPQKSLIARRRRMMLGVLAVTFVTFVLAVAGVCPWLLQLVFDLLLVAFCIHLRAQARRSAAVSRQRRRVTAAIPRPSAPSRPEHVAAPATAPAAEMQAPVAEPVAATGTDDLTTQVVTDEQTWDPIPVPRPTYTMKPPAPAPSYETYETYETYESDPLRDTEPHGIPVPPMAGSEIIATEIAEDQETDLDDILERRWAVND